MELKDGSWNFWCDWSLNHLFQNRSFVLAADNNNKLFAAHDRSDSHGIGLTWNIVLTGEETFICLDCGFGKVNAMCFILKVIGRFIETNMSVMTKT